MQLSINPSNIDSRKINSAVTILKNDGVIILPTDTVYALACSIHSPKAIEKICRIKNIKIEKANFSFLCSDLKNIADFTRPFDRSVFKLLNRCLPGPFTFILEANSNVPAVFRSKKKTIGIRIPNHDVTIEIIKQLGNPMMATSLHDDDHPVSDYLTDPSEIFEKFESIVDLIIDSGNGGNIPSTIVDCTKGEAVIVREGLGVI